MDGNIFPGGGAITFMLIIVAVVGWAVIEGLIWVINYFCQHLTWVGG